jgi:hypothetical protein
VEDISRHKAAVRRKRRELRDMLTDWDPIGIIGEDGEPRDEYDCLLGVIGDLRGGWSEIDLSRYLENQREYHFGLDPHSAQPHDFAHRVFEWYWSDPIPGSVPPSRRSS